MSLCAPWSTDDDLPETCDTTAVTPSTLESAHLYASEILYNLTKRKYPGECSDVWRPFGCNGCWSWCCGGEGHLGMELPGTPVRAITSIVVDGVTLDADDYQLHDRRSIRRTDGMGWPCGCDLDDEDAFVVTYTFGQAPTSGLVRASALLAWELSLAWTPDCTGECRLPKRVQTVTRQGVSFAVIDPLTVFKDGMTGVADVDLLLMAHDRGEARGRAKVAVPGARRAGHRI